jgi:hypothetical protein
MIETPAPVEHAAETAAWSAFLSIGTDDLTVSVLGIGPDTLIGLGSSTSSAPAPPGRRASRPDPSARVRRLP